MAGESSISIGTAVGLVTACIAGGIWVGTVQGDVAELKGDRDELREAIGPLQTRVDEIERTLVEFGIAEATADGFRERASELERQSARLTDNMDLAEIAIEGTSRRLAALTADASGRLEIANDLLMEIDEGVGISELASNREFREAVASALSPIPPGAVIASTHRCADLLPAGRWEDYGLAAGLFIVGVSDDYPLMDSRGEAEVALDLEHMPAHTHDFEVGSGNHAVVVDARTFYDGSGTAPIVNNTGRRHGYIQAYSSQTLSLGGNQPHNNMPPYIALYWCTPASTDAG